MIDPKLCKLMKKAETEYLSEKELIDFELRVKHTSTGVVENLLNNMQNINSLFNSTDLHMGFYTETIKKIEDRIKKHFNLLDLLLPSFKNYEVNPAQIRPLHFYKEHTFHQKKAPVIFDLICKISMDPIIYKKALKIGVQPTDKNIQDIKETFKNYYNTYLDQSDLYEILSLVGNPIQTLSNNKQKDETQDSLTKWLALSAALQPQQLEQGIKKLPNKQKQIITRAILKEILKQNG